MPYRINDSSQCAYVSINAGDASSARGLEEKGCTLIKQNIHQKVYCCGMEAAEQGVFSSGGLVIGPRLPPIATAPIVAASAVVTPEQPSIVTVTEKELEPDVTLIGQAKAFYRKSPTAAWVLFGIGALMTFELMAKPKPKPKTKPKV